MPYHEALDGVDICAIDNAGNKECVENVSIVKLDSANLTDVIAKGGNIVLPNDVTYSASDFNNIVDNTVITGNGTVTIEGSLNISANNVTLSNISITNGNLTISGDNVTLENVNITHSGTALYIDPSAENVIINGGVYNTTGGEQGQGTIRLDCTRTSTCSNAITIKDATIMGAIHLLNYNGSLENIKNNTLDINNPENSRFIGILVLSDDARYNQDSLNTLYSNNAILMNYYASTLNYYTAIQDTNWVDRYYIPVLNPNR